MLDSIAIALWVFLPAGAANMAPVFAAKISWLRPYSMPLDAGRKLGGYRILGKNKTWRGLLAGIIVATIIFGLQQVIMLQSPEFLKFLHPLQYASLPTLLVGPLFGLGALLGDALKSFFKRRIHIPPGKSWFPFDQIDYIVGSMVAISPFIRLSLLEYLVALVLWLGLHLVSVYVGWLLKIRRQPI